MKKIIALLLAAALALALGASALAVTYLYATGDVNLRTGPGTDYARITVIKKGSGLTMLSEGGSWSQVSYGGYTGYISNKYWAYR